jgi:hypothetical protein
MTVLFEKTVKDRPADPRPAPDFLISPVSELIVY